MDRIIKILSINASRILILFFFFLLYLLLPSGFSTTDGWNYAAEIKHNGEWFHPYHLLYNLAGYLFCYLPVHAGADTLACLKVMNALVAALTLLIVRKLMLKTGSSEYAALIASILTGASFSLMRYATENENYILPLFLGTLSLSYFISWLNSGQTRYLILASGMASFSVLFHVTYVFWWTGLLSGILLSGKRKSLPRFLFMSLIVPLAYLAVVYYHTGSLNRGTVSSFLFNEFVTHSKLSLSPRGIFFSAANLVRSFIQVHGYIVNMFRENLLLIIPGLISLLFFTGAAMNFQYIKFSTKETKLRKVLVIIISLNFLFALLSSGNAEFMVMLPLLIFILVQISLENCGKVLLMIAAGMLVWNISYGLIPLNRQGSGIEQYLADKSVNDNKVLIISSDDQRLSSMIYYRSGNSNIKNVLKSPALIKIKGSNESVLYRIIDSALINGIEVYTDCVGKAVLSRASISEGNINNTFFSRYSTGMILNVPSLAGTGTVMKIERK